MRKFLDPNEAPPNYSTWQLITDITALIKPYKWRFLSGSLLRVITDIVWLFPAYALATIINTLTNYQQGQSLQIIWLTIGLLILAALWRSVGIFYAKKFCYEVAERIALDAQLQTIGHMFMLDMAWHEKENSGNKIKRIQNAAQGLDKIIRIWVNSLIEITVNFIGIIFIVYKFDRTTSLILGLFLISYFTLSYFLTRKAAAAARAVNIQEEQVEGLIFESVNNIRSAKVLAMTKWLNETLTKYTSILYKKIQERIHYFQLKGSILAFLAQGFRIAGIVVIIVGITNHHYEVGFLVLFNGYFGYIWESISELSNASQDIVISRYAIARMKHILNETVTIDNEQNKTAFPKNWNTISIQDVSFAYGDNRVLKNISFEIKRGEKIGIVGLSGAGKSTMFKLLLKENENFTGQIMFDETPIQTIKKTDYFNHVAVVLQETEVFNFSLRDNITVANTNSKDNRELFDRSLSIAHVADFISKLPQGAETLIGEKGVKLSGGEKQRMSIARAVFKQPQILLLDEATSHLDLESEEKIRDSLHKFFENVTAIVIAHRLTTIREMDKILVMENGTIIEQGNFDQLYKQKGRFYELWEKQKL